MKSIKFANKRALLITSKDTKKIVKTKIKNIANINIDYKNYKLLNDSNLIHLTAEIKKYMFLPVSFGQKFLLYLTTLNKKKYCFFINKKKEDIISIRIRFSEDLYKNTLLDGELFKDKFNNWCYLITDLYIYKNINYIYKNIKDKFNKINYIFKEEYTRDNNLDPFIFHTTPLCDLKYFQDFTNNLRNNLNYKTSGISFKHLTSNNNYIYIYPENRRSKKKDSNMKKIIFKIKDTNLPDVYELYYLDKKKLIKYGIASIPSIEISTTLRNIFKNTDNDEDILFICNYSKNFKKFIPIECSKDKYISTLNDINSNINN